MNECIFLSFYINNEIIRGVEFGEYIGKLFVIWSCLSREILWFLGVIYLLFN